MFGATTWSIIKTQKSKLDGNCTRILRAILNIWRQYRTKSQISGLLLDISTILCKHRIHFAWHCCWAKQKLACDLLLWTPSHGSSCVGRPATTYKDQVCYGTKWLPNDLPTLMQDHDGWHDKIINVQARSTKKKNVKKKMLKWT